MTRSIHTRVVHLSVRAFFLALTALSPVAIFAQTASVAGVVADASGAVIPAASVVLTNTATALKLETKSGAQGNYLFPQVPVGPYNLQVNAEGFQPYMQTGIVLVVDQAANIPVRLNVGVTTETITVEANADLLNVSAPTLSQVIESERIEALPLNGRNPAALVFLAPGFQDAALVRGGGSTVLQGPNSYPTTISPSANGTRGGSSHFTLDGVLNLDNYQMNAAPFPNPDVTQEFSVLSSFNARYGFAAGGVVNLATRSGTNDFHGLLFEYHRNGALNARDFFAERHDNLKRDQFGGTAGFPILRDKIFFFGGYQGTRLRNTVEGVQRNLPSPEMRTGDYSALLPRTVIRNPITRQPYPGNRIPASDFSPAAMNFLKLLPLPPAGSSILVTSLPDRNREDQFTLKTDWNTERHRFVWRYFFADFSDPGLMATTDLTRAVQPQDKRWQSIMFGDTFSIRPNLINDLRVAFTRLGSNNMPAVPISPKQLGVKMTEGEIPFIQTFSIPGLAIGTGTRNNFPRWSFDIEQNTMWIRGAHQLSFGAQIVRLARLSQGLNAQNGAFAFNGQFSGNGFSDFMLGALSQFAQGDGVQADIRGGLWGFYVQDDIRATPTLTVNLGLRYDPHFPYQEADGRQVCWRPGLQSSVFTNAPLGYLAAGDAGCPAAGTKADLNNLQPRVGFAWNVLGLNTWSLRGGYGVYYQPLGTFFNTADLGQTPFTRGFTILPSGGRPISLDDPWRDVPGGDPFSRGFFLRSLPPRDTAFPTAPYGAYTWPEQFRLAHTQNWSLTLERALGRDMMLRTAYVGNKSTRLSYSRDINLAVPAPNAAPGNVQQRRPLPQFSQFLLYDDGGNANYHSLQVTFERRFSRGLSILTNYTWSKSIDEISNNASFFRLQSTLINSRDRRAQRGVSDFNIRHTFRSAIVWRAPELAGAHALVRRAFGNWGLSSMLTWRSGLPFSVLSGQDRSFTGTQLDLADLNPGANPELGGGRPQGEKIRRWFDTGAFSLAAPGTFGNSGRNSMAGPSRFNLDLSVSRRFRLSEPLELEFRGDFFNALNHTQLGNPVPNFVNPRFGEITGAAEPRILQFAGRIHW